MTCPPSRNSETRTGTSPLPTSKEIKGGTRAGRRALLTSMRWSGPGTRPPCSTTMSPRLPCSQTPQHALQSSEAVGRLGLSFKIDRLKQECQRLAFTPECLRACPPDSRKQLQLVTRSFSRTFTARPLLDHGEGGHCPCRCHHRSPGRHSCGHPAPPPPPPPRGPTGAEWPLPSCTFTPTGETLMAAGWQESQGNVRPKQHRGNGG